MLLAIFLHAVPGEFTGYLDSILHPNANKEGDVSGEEEAAMGMDRGQRGSETE